MIAPLRPREFIVCERQNGLEKSVWNYGATYSEHAGRNYYRVIEYIAYKAALDKIASLEKMIDVAEIAFMVYAMTNEAFPEYGDGARSVLEQIKQMKAGLDE